MKIINTLPILSILLLSGCAALVMPSDDTIKAGSPQQLCAWAGKAAYFGSTDKLILIDSELKRRGGVSDNNGNRGVITEDDCKALAAVGAKDAKRLDIRE
ncbi:hypothetical protein P5G64_16790 [Serratia nevei]|uniref:hypothetical protein n=1 Tax=Serratia TaxID=613 RepID=UPI000668800A|nr:MULTISPECIES: hypothetical protein [Serratia]MBX9282263.1 hypothetical protein [Serratia marcescens]MBX9287080.1 hypothetical protein [Serratia marcescens]MBX9292133.1 hypothetical protein [Serratia marcescens]MBX9301932.1 hypothetical protein [Serratia marcescens]MBX9308464.1 hypothetical protein [Serratia marcescens]